MKLGIPKEYVTWQNALRFAVGLLRGIVVVVLSYAMISFTFGRTGTAELVPCSVERILMFVYAFGYCLSLAKASTARLLLRDARERSKPGSLSDV